MTACGLVGGSKVFAKALQKKVIHVESEDQDSDSEPDENLGVKRHSKYPPTATSNDPENKSPLLSKQETKTLLANIS